MEIPSLDDWEKEWGRNSSRSVQPKLLPVDFRLPLAADAQSNERADYSNVFLFNLCLICGKCAVRVHRLRRTGPGIDHE
jgi:hypothetical protein